MHCNWPLQGNGVGGFFFRGCVVGVGEGMRSHLMGSFRVERRIRFMIAHCFLSGALRFMIAPCFLEVFRTRVLSIMLALLLVSGSIGAMLCKLDSG